LAPLCENQIFLVFIPKKTLIEVVPSVEAPEAKTRQLSG